MKPYTCPNCNCPTCNSTCPTASCPDQEEELYERAQTWGTLPLILLMEECAEVIQAASKILRRKPESREHLIAEVADLMVVLRMATWGDESKVQELYQLKVVYLTALHAAGEFPYEPPTKTHPASDTELADIQEGLCLLREKRANEKNAKQAQALRKAAEEEENLRMAAEHPHVCPGGSHGRCSVCEQYRRSTIW